MISFGLTEEQELIRDTVREFATSELADPARDADEQSRVPDDLLATTWELGLVNSSIPESYGGGGTGRSPITNAIVLEELGAASASLASAALAPSLFVNAVLGSGAGDGSDVDVSTAMRRRIAATEMIGATWMSAERTEIAATPGRDAHLAGEREWRFPLRQIASLPPG